MDALSYTAVALNPVLKRSMKVGGAYPGLDYPVK